MPMTELVHAVQVADYCDRNGHIPKDALPRKIILAWQRDKLLRLRRKKRESERSKMRKAT